MKESLVGITKILYVHTLRGSILKFLEPFCNKETKSYQYLRSLQLNGFYIFSFENLINKIFNKY